MDWKKLEKIALVMFVGLIWVLACFPSYGYRAQIGIIETYGQYAYIQTGHCKIEQITIINLDRTDKAYVWKYRAPNRLKWADTLRANAFTWYNAVVWKGCE